MGWGGVGNRVNRVNRVNRGNRGNRVDRRKEGKLELRHCFTHSGPPTSPGALRPPGRNPCTKRPQPWLRVPRIPWERRRPRRPQTWSVSRRGRRRSQDAMTNTSRFELDPHQQAQRPRVHLRLGASPGGRTGNARVPGRLPREDRAFVVLDSVWPNDCYGVVNRQNV